jgi:hypothetical protein
MTTTASLADRVHGPVLHRGHPGVTDEVAGFNAATVHDPETVVGATCTADVVGAVRWAAEHGRPVAVQATGHGAGTAVGEGLLVSTRRMNDVAVDPATRTATIAAGATWRDVLAAGAPHGLAGLAGSATSVGAVGYTVGGGVPVVGRPFGYGSDYVRRFEVVTADGALRTVDEKTDAELFWALRGGKSNAGIVTSMVCELVPLSTLYGGSIFFPGAQAAPLLSAYAQWSATLPDRTSTSFQLLRLPPFPEIPEPLRGQFVVQLCVAHLGEPDEAERLLAPMRGVTPAVIDTVQLMDYADLDRIHQDPDHPVPAREGCAVLDELSPEVVSTILELGGPDSGSPLLLLALRQLGGALAAAPRVPDAVCLRDAAFVFQTVGVLAGPHAAEVLPATAAAQAAMEPFSGGRTTVNLHGAPGDAADRARAWTPDVYARLRAVKRKYDPDNLLRFGHAVPLP